MMWMPNPSVISSTPNDRIELEGLEAQLRLHVERLSIHESGRNFINMDNLTPARNYIFRQFSDLGLEPRYQTYEIYGDEYSNIIVDIPGKSSSKEILVIGAHYDSVENSPGANDNASGVSALVEIARYISNNPASRTVRFIAFANEEPPYFQSEEMGSMVYVNSLGKENENIVGMISIESIGFYTNQPDSQAYPRIIDLFYPDTGNFVAFIGNLNSRSLVSTSISIFRENSEVPSEGISSPAFVPGVSWSDHWSFWVAGHNAIMVTDTAPFRYEHYHKITDTPDKLNYEQYSKVVLGLFKVVEGIANNGV